MRCVDCKRTGFTEQELGAHEAKTGHKRPANRAEWDSPKEFAPTSGPNLSKKELLEAMSQMLTSDDLVAWAKEVAAKNPDKLPPPPGGRS